MKKTTAFIVLCVTIVFSLSATAKDCAAVSAKLKAAVQANLKSASYESKMYDSNLNYTREYCTYLRVQAKLDQAVVDIVDRNPDCKDRDAVPAYRRSLKSRLEGLGECRSSR